MKRLITLPTDEDTELSATTVKALTEEIRCILERNQNEKFLRKLLTRAIILEKLLKDCTGKEARA